MYTQDSTGESMNLVSDRETTPLRIGMIAGEMSGDSLGAGLIRELRRKYPQLIIEGIGGPQMIAEGMQSIANMDELAMMGYVEPLLNLPRLLSLRRRLWQHFVDNPPALFLGIDYAYFNNSLEQRLKQQGILTAHYVSPQLWASRPQRIHKLAQTVDLMLCLFPFEVDIYQQHNIRAAFVGHPLADKFSLQPDTLAARGELNLPLNKKIVALLPGSRANEVKHLLPEFIGAARLCLAQEKDLSFVLPAANEKRRQQIASQLPGDLPIKLVLGQSHRAMAAADVVLLASGTTTLEAMLLKKPMVVSYKLSSLNYAIMSRMLTSEHIALPNILANARLVPEIVQTQVSAQVLADAVMDYFLHPEKVTALVKQFTEMHQSLQQGGDKLAASALLELIAEHEKH